MNKNNEKPDVKQTTETFSLRRSAYELMKEPDDMTQEEKERLVRIRAIPDIVREVIIAEKTSLFNQIVELEGKYEKLCDYLEGYVK